jgi:putative multiple sugar transport system substrate-binding protein
MQKTLKLFAVATTVGVMALAGCGRQEAAPGGDTSGGASGGAPAGFAKDSLIGVALPQKTSENWVLAENLFKTDLGGGGYKFDVQFANGGVTEQQNQISTMVTKGAKVIVVGAIDGAQLGTQVKAAHDAGATVIAYDRLLKNTDAVDYYIAYDNRKVGQLQGQALLDGMAKKKPNGPYNIELFAGSPDDNNATFFFNGAMSVLKPYVDKGTLVVKSGQTDFSVCAILRWDPATAQKRMEDLLTKTYNASTKVAGVLSPYDGLSIGILSALKSNGYGTAGQPYPVVTGQDAEVASVKSIVAGEQYSTVFKDTRQLAKTAVDMTQALLTGAKPQVNNTKDYDNGKKVVPSFLLQPVIVTKDNYQQALVDSGYYTATELK